MRNDRPAAMQVCLTCSLSCRVHHCSITSRTSKGTPYCASEIMIVSNGALLPAAALIHCVIASSIAFACSRSDRLICPGLSCRQMLPDEFVFVPNEAHHEDIENGEDDQPSSVRVREPVKLIDDEQPEHDQRGQI